MEEFMIKAPEGMEIDKEQLNAGKIVFISKSKKYPTELGDLKSSIGTILCYIDAGDTIELTVDNTHKRDCSGYFESEDLAEAFLILADLIRFRDEYRDGWVPDWKDDNTKYIILCFGNLVSLDEVMKCNSIFAFQSHEVRYIFYRNFKKQLEILSKHDLL